MYPEDTFSYGAARTVFLSQVIGHTNLRKSVDPDQTPSYAASDLVRYCLHLIHQLLHPAIGSRMDL